MRKKAEDILSSYIDALHPIIYINHFDFKVIDEIITKIGQNIKIVEFNNALGSVDFYTKNPMLECNLEKFFQLSVDDGFDNETYIVLKDIHEELNNQKVIAYLKRIAENNLYNDEYRTTIFIISSKVVIPTELENYITVFDIPLPTSDEIMRIIKEFVKTLEIEVEQDVINDIALSFKGLNEFQIKQILNLAYQDGGDINSNDKYLILKEKEQFIKKSGMLEIVNFKETIDNIGGLENLKDWLYKKAKVFNNLDKAIKFGVDIPKGIMIIGMPGCGKSLTAKATASLFEIPLVRLDVGRLLGKYVGESETNMRKALKLSEAISPCVLWIDEIEKAFSGVGGDGGGSDVTTRLFGHFLTWMQEKENTVFIVATANDISKIPPEFLRKGRFDELFFVDLPNGEERRKILEIHLKKRNKWNKEINSISLIKETEGFNGADLEAVVKDTIENAFIDDKLKITTEDLTEVIKDTKSISSTLKEKIEQIRNTVGKIDIKPASKAVNIEKIEVTNTKGNTGGNLINGGLVAKAGDWIYYCNVNDNGYIYKIKTDGTYKLKLNSDKSFYINVVDDWIYYQNDNDNYIYKIKTDGTGKIKLNSDKSYYINVIDDWIYYQNDSDNCYLYKIRTDGKSRVKLNSDYSYHINVVDDWIYYQNNSDNCIYKIKTNGTGKLKLNSDNSYYINAVDNWIYYKNYNDGGFLYKIKNNGTGRVKLNSDNSYYINVVDDWIYYYNGSDNGYLYKIKTDGTDRVKLNDNKNENINIVDNWIYYYNGSDNGYLYKIKTDGTGRIKVE